jgi:lipoprotein-anchoring transpeptidase ErfK/SrfK
MRKSLMCFAIILCAGIALPAPATASSAHPTEQELLVLKKKKAEAKRQAAAKTKAAVHQSAKPARPQVRSSAAQSSRCRGFLGCLFGRKPNPNIRPASAARDTGYGSDYATAKMVNWHEGKYSPGSIVVRTPERALYLVLGDGKARRYAVGVGREGFQWSGNSRIVAKAEWPTWRPPQTMIEREAAKGHYLPAVMEGGPDNPLGARALYIGGTIFRIHGTNNAASIGGAVSSGCIRMMNTDVIDLYGRVKVGALVYVYQ